MLHLSSQFYLEIVFFKTCQAVKLSPTGKLAVLSRAIQNALQSAVNLNF